MTLHKQQSDKPIKPIPFLWEVIKPYKYCYLVMVVGPISSGLHPIMYNYAVKLLIDLCTRLDYITFAQAFWPIFWFIGAHVILDVSWRLHNFAQLKSIPYVFERMMYRICQHVFYLPLTYFQDNLSGSISGKIRGIGDSYLKLQQAIEFKLSRPLFLSIFAGVGLACINFKIFVFAVVFTTGYMLLAAKLFFKLAQLEQARQNSWYYLFGTIADRIQNITNIFTFATREHEIKVIQKYYQNTHNPISINYYKYDFKICIILSLLYWVLMTAIFIFLIYIKNIAKITAGEVAFILSMIFIFAENSWSIIFSVKNFLEDLAAFRVAFKIMQIPKCQIDKPNAAKLKVSQGEIIFQNVSFIYESGRSVFKNLNLHIKPGQKVGLVGYSGAGKSTLINLLLKNFKITEGNIYIDDQNIYDFTSDSLRTNIALIPQNIVLFHRSIGENIAYAKIGASQEEVEQAAKMANIHEFIVSLPNGYDTLVGERGTKLSGGQMQRIAIARAILKNAKILVLDEATSNLDAHTENEIQKSINAMLESNKATVIAIAHRLSTIKHMDRIVVFENGAVVEDGIFDELINIKNGKFKELWEQQVNGILG